MMKVTFDVIVNNNSKLLEAGFPLVGHKLPKSADTPSTDSGMVWPGETPIEVLRKKSVMLACFLLLGTAFKANEAPAALVASSTPPTALDSPPKRGPWVGSGGAKSQIIFTTSAPTAKPLFPSTYTCLSYSMLSWDTIEMGEL